jgi:hypothetical protein
VGRFLTLLSVVVFLYALWEGYGSHRSLSSSSSYRGCNDLIIESPFPAHTNLEACKVISGVVIII